MHLISFSILAATGIYLGVCCYLLNEELKKVRSQVHQLHRHAMSTEHRLKDYEEVERVAALYTTTATGEKPEWYREEI